MTQPDPILLFGLPRSGTTWLGKLLDSHPDTLYRHEPDSVRRLNIPLFPNLQDGNRYRRELEVFNEALPDIRVPKVAAKQPLFPKRYLSRPSLMAYRVGMALAKAGGRRAQGRPVLFAPNALNFNGRRVVWKSIESLGRLGVCMSALPQARAVLILRHPCGYVASVQRGETGDRFSSRTPSSEDYGLFAQLLETDIAKRHKLEFDALRAMVADERLAWRWLLTCEKALADTENCDRVRVVRYEDVCANPVEAVAHLFEFVGLDWDPQTAAFITASTSGGDAGYYSVFHDPLKAANRWQTELSAAAVARILKILQCSRLKDYYDCGRPEAKRA